MMYRVGNLLCIVAIWLHFGTGSSSLPELDLSCEKSGKIAINNANKYNSVYVIQGTNRAGSCVGSYNAVSGDNTKITIDKCAPDFIVRIAVMAVNQTAANVIGGSEVALYDVTCYSGSTKIASSNIEDIKTASVQITDQSSGTPKPKLGTDVVIMTISQQSHVVIGDSLTLKIEGPDKLAYFAHECKAFDTDHHEKERILITDGSVDKVNGDPSLMQDFSTAVNSAQHTVSMSSVIHAFHFASGNSVTFQCKVLACSDKQSCGTGSKVAGIRRRKRNSDLQQHILNSTIMVHDRWTGEGFQGRSSGYSNYIPNWMIMFLAALWNVRLACD